MKPGKALAEGARNLLLASDIPGASVVVSCSDLIEKFRPQINMGLIMMTNMMAYSGGQQGNPQAESMQGMAKFVEGEMRVLLSIASQVDLIEVTAIPSAEGLAFSQTMSVKENTPLHNLITAPEVLKPDPAITVEALEPAMFGIELFLSNPEALNTYLKAETDQLVKDMMLNPETVAQWTEMLGMWSGFMSGSMAETVNMDPETGMSVAYILSMGDEDAFLKIMENMPTLMEPFTTMYEEMGMPMNMDINLNSREYKGKAIHAYDFGYDLDAMNPEMAEAMSAIQRMGDLKSEFTVVDNRLLWTMGNFPLNRLVDTMLSGENEGRGLFSRKVYPEGGFLYYDINMGLYLNYIAAFMPMEEVKEVLASVVEKLNTAPPLTGAGFQQENLVQWRMDLPVALLETIAHFWAVESTTTMEIPQP